MRFDAAIVAAVSICERRERRRRSCSAARRRGRRITSSLSTPPADLMREQLQADVEKVLAEIDRQMSTYRPDSEMSRFNRAPAGEWFAVSPATAEVVAAAQEISEKTDGAMDVTVGPLVRLWHFGPKESDGGGKADGKRFVPPIG